jgi:hypothetical protein
VQQHLAVCEGCFHHFEFDRRLLDSIRQKCRTGRAPESLRRRVTRTLARL